MPVYKVQAPDGRVLNIDGPEGATDEQLMRVAMGEYQRVQTAIAKDRANIEAQDKRMNPANDTSFLGKLGAGFDTGIANVGRRATALLLPESITPEFASDENIAEQERLSAPLKGTKAGAVGNLAGEIAATSPLGVIGNAARGAGAAARFGAGALEGGLSGHVTTGDADTGAAIGAGLGVGLPYVTRLLRTLMGKGGNEAAEQAAQQTAQQATPTPPPPAGGAPGAAGQAIPEMVPGSLSSGQQRAIEWAQKTGMETTPAMRTGSKNGAQIEAALESSPMTSGPFNKIKEANQLRANEIVGEAIGVKGTKELSEETLGKAKSRIQEGFEKAADDKARWSDRSPVERVAAAKDLIDEAGSELVGTQTLSQLTPLAARFQEAAATGVLTGKRLQKWSQQLNKLAKQMRTNNQGLEAEAIDRFKDGLDDVLAEGLDETTLAGLQTARQQYRILKILEQPGVLNPASGHISIKSLGNALQRVDKNGYMYGGNSSDLYNLARFGKAFPTIADSGTATRTSLNNVLDLTSRLAGNVGSRAYLHAGEAGINAAEAAGRAAQTGGRVAQQTGQSLARTLESLGRKVPRTAPIVAANRLYNDDEER